MRKVLYPALVGAMLGLAGCNTVSPAGYYWGDYSDTLYAYTKAPSSETLAAHTAELEDIIQESQERNLKVPPGIHAELGYIMANRGDSQQAVAHYQAEMQLYPESRLFIERLIAQTNDTKR